MVLGADTMQQQLDFKTIREGSKITARPDGKVRGGEVLQINQDGSIKAVFYCPKKQITKLQEDEFVLSEDWNKEMNL